MSNKHLPHHSCGTLHGLSRRDFVLLPAMAGVAMTASQALAAETYRRTYGIVSNLPSSDPAKEADVIMTAVILGFSADYYDKYKTAVRFDIDPVDAAVDAEKSAHIYAIGALNKALKTHLKLPPIAQAVAAGEAPGTEIDTSTGKPKVGGTILGGAAQGPNPSGRGQVAMGANMANPFPANSKAEALWNKLKEASLKPQDKSVAFEELQYIGRGAYTGFIETPNNGDPIGPMSTVRMVVPPPTTPIIGSKPPVVPHARWLPAEVSDLWVARTKENKERLTWGLILPQKKLPNGTKAIDTEKADAFTNELNQKLGMKYVPPTVNATQIVTYTHGMIQAIYRAKNMGPTCRPFEIAVGTQTTKLASCLPCTLFMYATGYPPSSIHLGSGESWAPLSAPYDPTGKTPPPGEADAIRDLNNMWYEKCLAWLKEGVAILKATSSVKDGTTANKADYRPQLAALDKYLTDNGADKTVGGALVLDAVTVHKKEQDRVYSVMKL